MYLGNSMDLSEHDSYFIDSCGLNPGPVGGGSRRNDYSYPVGVLVYDDDLGSPNLPNLLRLKGFTVAGCPSSYLWELRAGMSGGDFCTMENCKTQFFTGAGIAAAVLAGDITIRGGWEGLKVSQHKYETAQGQTDDVPCLLLDIAAGGSGYQDTPHDVELDGYWQHGGPSSLAAWTANRPTGLWVRAAQSLHVKRWDHSGGLRNTVTNPAARMEAASFATRIDFGAHAGTGGAQESEIARLYSDAGTGTKVTWPNPSGV
jgi:hypothetical protein